MSNLEETVYGMSNERFENINASAEKITKLWGTEYLMRTSGGKIDKRLLVGIECLLYVLIAFFDARYARKEVSK